jgi:hypothetical protein
VKVLDQKDWENWRHQCTCMHCETKVEIEPKDLCYSPTQDDGPVHQPEYFGVRCPVCSEAIVIPHREIPLYLQKLTRERSERLRTSYFDR